MAKISNSVMDEFGKIALDKGWIIDKKEDIVELFTKEAQYANPFTNDNEHSAFKKWLGGKDQNALLALNDLKAQKKIFDEAKTSKQRAAARKELNNSLLTSVSWWKKNAYGREGSPYELGEFEVKMPHKKRGRSGHVKLIQRFLKEFTGMNVSNPKSKYKGGPDGFWGGMTAAAWNAALKKLQTQYPHDMIKKVLPGTASKGSPSPKELRKMEAAIRRSVSLKATEPKPKPEVKPAVQPPAKPKSKLKGVTPYGKVQERNLLPTVSGPSRVPTGKMPPQPRPGVKGRSGDAFEELGSGLDYMHKKHPGATRMTKTRRKGPKGTTTRETVYGPRADDNFIQEANMSSQKKTADFPMPKEHIFEPTPRAAPPTPAPTPQQEFGTLSIEDQKRVKQLINTGKPLTDALRMLRLKKRVQQKTERKPVIDPTTGLMIPDWAVEKKKEEPLDWTKNFNVEEFIRELTEKSLQKMKGEEIGDVKPTLNAKDMNITASVINELVSLANDLEGMGEGKIAEAIDLQLKTYKEAADKLYDITGETGEQLVGQAHPGGGPTLVPAAEEGGKVETIVEEHKKVVDKATKQPTGKLAETIQKLLVTANKLEENGEVEAAKMVDKTIRELYEASSPFVNRSSASEATDSEDAKASIKEATSNFFGQFYSRLDSVIGALESAKSGIESWTLAGEDHNLMKSKYSAVIGTLKNILSKFDSIKSGTITIAIDRQIKRLEHTGLNLDKAFFGSGDIERHNKAVALGRKLVNDMKSFKGIDKKPGEKTTPGDITAYLSSLKKLQVALSNPVSKEKLLKILGKGKREEGYGERTLLLQKIEKEIASIKSGTYKGYEAVAGVKNDELWTDIIHPLIKWKAFLASQFSRKATVRKQNLTKEGWGGVKVKAPPSTRKGKPGRRGRGRRISADENVRKLQQLIMNAGISIGKGIGGRRDDGVWGSKTAAAYNQLMASFKERFGPETKVYTVTKSHPGNRAIMWGIYAAKQISPETGGLPASDIIDLMPGVKVAVGSLYTKTAFINALRALRKAGKLPKVTADKELDAAFGVLSKFYNKLVYDRGYKRKFIARSGDPKYVDKLLGIITDLGAQLKGSPGRGQKGRGRGKARLNIPLLGSKMGKIIVTINNAHDLVNAVASLPRREFIRNDRMFKNISRKLGKTPEGYTRYINNLLAIIQTAMAILRGELEASLEGGAAKYNQLLRYISSYQTDIEILSEHLKVDLDVEPPKPKIPPKPKVKPMGGPGSLPELMTPKDW